MRLIKLYEEVFTSNLVLSLIYKRNHRKYKLNIMNSEDTIKYVMQHDCSIARFGEGELELILYKDKDLGFQKHSDGLAEKLKMVLNSNNERLLICIPYAFNTIVEGQNIQECFGILGLMIMISFIELLS